MEVAMEPPVNLLIFRLVCLYLLVLHDMVRTKQSVCHWSVVILVVWCSGSQTFSDHVPFVDTVLLPRTTLF